MKVDAAIPTSSQVANATNSGEPITSAIPKHPVSVAVTNLGRSLTVQDADESAVEPTNGVAAPKRGLLRRNSR